MDHADHFSSRGLNGLSALRVSYSPVEIPLRLAITAHPAWGPAVATSARRGGLDSADRLLQYQLGWPTLPSTQHQGVLVHLLELAGQTDAIDQVDGNHMADQVAQESRLQGVRRWFGRGLG